MRGNRPDCRHLMLVLCHMVSVPVLGRLAPSEDFISGCRTSHDWLYGGTLVSCSGLEMRQLPADLLAHNVTTLILQANKIHTLYNRFFLLPQLSNLRHLDISYSQVSSIEVDALSGLSSLETLDLEHNDLALCRDERSFPTGMFEHVPNLRHLFIGYNTVREEEDSSGCQNYSEHINITSLRGLTNLTIDALGQTLFLGREFAQLTLLENITVVCNFVLHLTNTSLEGLRQLQVRVLSLVNFQRALTLFELGLFQNLSSLTHLTVDDSHVGNHNILQALEPLANRSMVGLYLRKTNVFATYSAPGVALKDGIIGEDLSRPLISICLRNFFWIDSFLFAFKPNSLTTGAWRRCITSMDFSRNKLETIGWVVTLFEVRRLLYLSHLTISSVVTPPDKQYPHINLPAGDGDHAHSRGLDLYSGASVTVTSNNEKISEHSSHNFSHNDNINTRILVNSAGKVHNRTCKQNQQPQIVLPLQKQKANSIDKTKFPWNGNITYYFPPSLRTLKIINIIFSPCYMGTMYIVCASNENFQELYWINNQLVQATGVFYGVDKLKVLDISGSYFEIADHLFDTFQGLEAFVLRDMKPDTFFRSISVKRLLRNLTNIRYLDVSNNRLNSRLFPPDTFSTTPNISQVNLSQNRFSGIPFDLETTPKLRVLDLSENAILFLTEGEREALNRHVGGVGEFLLKLEDNAIACVCSQIGFMVWMFVTPVSIQLSTPFTCLSDDGSVLVVNEAEDIPQFCIICQGRLFLMATVILTSVVVIAFLSAYLWTRFRTRIEATIIKLFVAKVRPAQPGDYQTGVFIGYADDDCAFARHVLMKYLEESCHVSTYVHQRDLQPGYKVQQFDQAMARSWRVLLLLSSTFLHNYDMSEIVIKLATHSVTAMNRKRVFVLVERGQVHALPDDLYDVLDETRILLFDDFRHQLDYEQKQRIKYCLTPSH